MAGMTTATPLRRRVFLFLWKAMNPLAKRLAGIAPWWVVVETTGSKSGRVRQTPLARGPVEDGVMWLLAAHGRHAFWVRNIERDGRVRVRLRGRWHDGSATVEALDRARLPSFNRYARAGAGPPVAVDPCLVRVELDRR
jgi:deazaflavin-dependent oxidoreductase (nitroreductase family)